MTNRNEGQKFSTAGRPPEGSWMDSGQTRPSWRRKAIRNTTDSGMGSMETQYGLIPPQPGARKRHADDEMLRRRYMDGQNDTNGVQWDGPHKRISFDSEDPESTLSGSESRPGWPPDDLCADSTRYKGSFDEREREGLQLVSPAVREKVLKLQRDLEEAKAESRYLRSRPVDGLVVKEPDYESEPVCMVSVNKQNSQGDQTDELLRKLLEAITPVTPPPVRVPKADPLDRLTELLMSQMVKSEPVPPPPVEPTGVELLLQNYFAKQRSAGLGPRARQMRRNWADVQCFSCGKPGHSATRCPT